MNRNMQERRDEIPVWEKAMLTIKEAAAYTGIGVNKLRDMSDDASCDYVLWVGSRRMFKRKKLEEFLEKTYSV
ncbi:MAG: helix-turn-helix domain-containing protein [Lachnospiraceae bacterium]|nr:helix-turn-helix domain-containing protein [Lachnospiraceae bacterium]